MAPYIITESPTDKTVLRIKEEIPNFKRTHTSAIPTQPIIESKILLKVLFDLSIGPT